MQVINLRAKPLPRFHCRGEKFAVDVAEWSVVTVPSRELEAALAEKASVKLYSLIPGILSRVKPLWRSGGTPGNRSLGSPGSYGAGLEPGRGSKSQLCKSS